jgi:hypothetical protein
MYFQSFRIIISGPLGFSQDWISESHNQRKLVDIEPYLMHAEKPFFFAGSMLKSLGEKIWSQLNLIKVIDTFIRNMFYSQWIISCMSFFGAVLHVHDFYLIYTHYSVPRLTPKD